MSLMNLFSSQGGFGTGPATGTSWTPQATIPTTNTGLGAVTSAPPSAYTAQSTTNWGNPQAGLGQDVLDFYNNYQSSATPTGPWSSAPQIDFNRMYRTPGSAYDPTQALQASNGSNMPGTVAQHGLGNGQLGYMYTPTTSNPGHRGDPYYLYNADGSFNGMAAFEKDPMSNPLMGVASVVGAGLGMGAIGAAAAGGAAAGAGAGAATGADMSAFYGGLDGGATLGGGGSIGGGSVLGGVGSFVPSTAGLGTAMAGGGGQTAATGAAFNPAVDSQLASSQLGITGSQAAADAVVPSVTANGLPGSSMFSNFLPSTGGLSLGQFGQGAGALSSLLGGGGGAGGTGTGAGSLGGANLTQLLGGLNDAYQRNQSSQAMINWLNQQQAKVDGLYAPGSPEYNQLWDQMSRNDAAAGRNSQYGPRSVDLAAKIAQIKADNTVRLTAGSARGMADALTQQGQARSLPGLMSALGNGGGGANLSSLVNSLNGSTGASTANNFVTPNPFYTGGDPNAVAPSQQYTGPDPGSYDISDWWATA